MSTNLTSPWSSPLDAKFLHMLQALWYRARRNTGVIIARISTSTLTPRFVSPMDVTSSLTMPGNCQPPSSLGPYQTLQLPLAQMTQTASASGSEYNSSKASAPPIRSEWLQPSAPGTSSEPVMAGAHLYSHSMTAVVNTVTGQSQMSAPAASNPGILTWDILDSTGHNASSLEAIPVTVTDPAIAPSVLSRTALQPQSTEARAGMNRYLSLPTSLVTTKPSEIQGNQLYYCTGGTTQMPTSYGSVAYPGARACAPQPEFVMVLRQVRPTFTSPTTPSTIGMYYPTASAPPITGTNIQVAQTSLQMKPSLGWQAPRQTFSQAPLGTGSSPHPWVFQTNPPREPGITSTSTASCSSPQLLALSPATSQEEPVEENGEEPTTPLSEPQEAHQILKVDQGPPFLPREIAGTPQILATGDPVIQQKPDSDQDDRRKNGPGGQDQATGGKDMESSPGLADLATLGEDIHLPRIFLSLKDLDQLNTTSAIQDSDTRATKRKLPQGKTTVTKGASQLPNKKKQKASEAMGGAPEAKILATSPQSLLESQVVACQDVGPSGPPDSTAHPSLGTAVLPASGSRGRATVSRPPKTERARGNHPKKAGGRKQGPSTIVPEEKPTIPKRKRKTHPPELSQEAFKKPRSSLAAHMLESVQVFHALGRKSDKTTGLLPSRALGNKPGPTQHMPRPPIKPGLDAPLGGKGPQEDPGTVQQPHGSAQDKGLPPRKVTLIPLPFLSPDKPPTPPGPRKTQPLVPRRPPRACPTQAAATTSAQPGALHPPQQVPAITTIEAPAKPTHHVSTSAAQPDSTPSAAPQLTASHSSSAASLQCQPLATTVARPRSPPKPQNHFPLQDFRFQRIPWREPNVPEPVMSSPITEEQRPEREAMKRQAQRERAMAAKYTAWGKVQFFCQRERDMQMAQYYGYC
ncbi:uncharacterized protein C2orf78-like [Ctenodactylus gundi]